MGSGVAGGPSSATPLPCHAATDSRLLDCPPKYHCSCPRWFSRSGRPCRLIENEQGRPVGTNWLKPHSPTGLTGKFSVMLVWLVLSTPTYEMCDSAPVQNLGFPASP